MRPIVIFLAIAGAGIITWLIVARPDKKDPEKKQEAIEVSKYNELFNGQVASTMNDYYEIIERFVNWDSSGANTATATLIKDLDNIHLDELKKDSSI